MKEKTKNFLWSEPELRLLAETITEPKSKKVKDVNLVASNILGTSSQAIQKIRPKSEYKLVENRIKNKLSVEQNPQVNVEQTPLPSVDIQSVKPSPQQTPLRLTCIGQSPQIQTNNNSSSTQLLNTASNVEKTLLQHLNRDRSLSTPANLLILLRRSALFNVTDNLVQTLVNPITRPVNTPLRCILPNVSHTPFNVTNILSTTNIPIEVDIFTPTAKAKPRQLPETPSGNIEYKQSSLNEICRYLALNSPAWNSWDSFVSSITMEKFDRPKLPRVWEGPLMMNRRENRNTRKAKIYQFTQKAFEQN